MINVYLLLGIGFVLAIIELLIGSFYVIFFALAFLLVGILSLFLSLNLVWQIILIVLIALVSFVIFRKFFKKSKKEENLKDNFLDESGEGVIRNGMIYYKGTLWQSNEIKDLKDGDRVRVTGVKANQIQIIRE